MLSTLCCYCIFCNKTFCKLRIYDVQNNSVNLNKKSSIRSLEGTFRIVARNFVSTNCRECRIDTCFELWGLKVTWLGMLSLIDETKATRTYCFAKIMR